MCAMCFNHWLHSICAQPVDPYGATYSIEYMFSAVTASTGRCALVFLLGLFQTVFI